MDEFCYRQEDIAKAVGKSRSHVANLLRVLTLPDSVRLLIGSGQISLGHAKILVGVEGAEKLSRKILEKNLSVRDTEKFLSSATKNNEVKRNSDNKRQAKEDEKNESDIAIANLEKIASRVSGFNIEIKRAGRCRARYNTISFPGRTSKDTR